MKSDSGATTKGLEASINDLNGLLIDLDLQLHHITARGTSDESCTDTGIVLVERPDVAGVIVMVNDVLVV